MQDSSGKHVSRQGASGGYRYNVFETPGGIFVSCEALSPEDCLFFESVRRTLEPPGASFACCPTNPEHVRGLCRRKNSEQNRLVYHGGPLSWYENRTACCRTKACPWAKRRGLPEGGFFHPAQKKPCRFSGRIPSASVVP